MTDPSQISGVQKYNLDLPDSAAISQTPDQAIPEKTVTEEKSASQQTDEQQDCDWNIKKLKEEIAILTGVPVEGQRLIRKGSTLFGDDTQLATLNLAAGEKIMVLGQKPELPESPAVKSLHTIERTVLQGIEKKIKDVDSRLQGIQQGFLTKDLVCPTLNELDKQLKGLGEDCMKTLEVMDAMQLGDDGNQARSKRKTLVLRVQDLLRWHDDLGERLEAISADLNTKRTNGILRD